MDSVDLRKAQLCQLEIAKEVKRLCEKHNIKYFLAYGSMIGAIRHKGFIPWDDDLDIAFLRKEFDKFFTVCRTELDKKFFLQTYETDPYFTWPYAKLQMKNTVYKEIGVDDRMASGVFIDLFPLENAPRKNAQIIKLKYKYYLKLLQIKSNYTVTIAENKRILKLVMKLLSNLYDIKWLKKKVRSLATSYKNDTSEYVYNIHSPYSVKKEIMPRKWFKSYCKVDFENDSFAILKEYDAYLRQLYGDYMKLPPKSQRENRHQIVEFSCFNNEE